MQGSYLLQGNGNARAQRWEEAIQCFGRALVQTPKMAKSIVANIHHARTRLQRSGACSGRAKTVVCGWELSHNAAGRAHTLALLHQRIQKTALVGFLFPSYGDGVWFPIRDEPVLKCAAKVSRRDDFFSHAVELVVDNPAEVVHLSKPRGPNLVVGMLYKLLWGSTVMMDVDDEELAFVKMTEPIPWMSVHDRDVAWPTWKEITGPRWTQLAVGVVDAFDGTTVSNECLKKVYGGEVIPHARDEIVFDPENFNKASCKRNLGISPSHKVIIFLGTPRRHKGVIEISSIVRRISQEKFVFLIVGDMADEELRLQVEREAGPNLKMMPNQPFSQIPSLLAAADFCLLLQERDSRVSNYQMPAKLTDALAMKIPVLASEVPPLTSMFDAGVLIPMPLHDEEKTLLDLMQDASVLTQLQDRERSYFLAHMSFSAAGDVLKGCVNNAKNTRLSEQTAGDTLVSMVECMVS